MWSVECCFSCAVEEGYIKLQVKLSKFATNCGTKGFDMHTFCFFYYTVQKNQKSNWFELLLHKDCNELHLRSLLLAAHAEKPRSSACLLP